MAIITLTTDWNEDDYYTGSVKGAILSAIPDATIVDITHKIKSFNILQAAFILRNSFRQFPTNTIHVIGVNTEESKDQSTLVVRAEDHYFISSDNGIFSLVFQNRPEWIIQIDSQSTTFPELETYVNIIKTIVKREEINKLGKRIKDFQQKVPIRATIDDSVITGSVIHIDSYKNAITNITKELFNRIGNNRSFELFVQSNSYKIKKISTTYNDTSPGELLAIFNSLDLLEIAINKGNAADLLNLSTNSSVRIIFQ